jgi:hypothetical protein
MNLSITKWGITVFPYIKLKERPILCKELTEKQKNNNSYNFGVHLMNGMLFLRKKILIGT